MINYVKHGDEMPYTNSGSGITSGSVVKIGDIIGVAQTDILQNSTGTVVIAGVFELAKTTSQAWTQGQRLYWDPTASKFTTAADDGGSPATAFTHAGWAYADAASADITGLVKLKIS